MKKILVFGGSGLVGSKFIDLNSNKFNIISPLVTEIDILNKDQISKAIEDSNPDSIINFAAFTDVEKAEEQQGNEEGLCFQINVQGAKNVAQAAKDADKYLIHISTEYVFDGLKEDSPYTEEDKPNPINWYGQTKFIGEQFVLETGGKAMILRISMPFSAYYELKKDVARFFLEQLKMSNQLKAVEDQRITPTLTGDIANALNVLLNNQTTGVCHVCSKDSVSPLEFAKTIAETFNLDYSLISSISLDEYNKNKNAKLLKYSWLNSAKFSQEFGDDILHTVKESLVIFKKEIDQRE